mgnify:CR=1 FL=1
MPRLPALAACHSSGASRRFATLLPLVLGLGAILTAGLAVVLIGFRVQLARSEHVLVPAAIVLIACVLIQGRVAWEQWAARRASANAVDWANGRFLGRLVIGVFLAYAAATIVGPVPRVDVAFLTAAVAWYTVLVAASTGMVPRVAGWLPPTHGFLPRGLGRIIVASIILVVAAEACLQGYKRITTSELLATMAVSPTVESAGAPALAAGRDVVDERVSQLAVGPLRVAVLSDELPTRGAAESAYLDRVERELPGVRIVSVESHQPWTRHAAGEITEQLVATRTDLALIVLSVCDDLTREVPAASWFDWRQFELARALGASSAAPETRTTAVEPADDLESFCETIGPQLAACRTPIDDKMRKRWARTYRRVDRLVAQCRAADLAVAVVLVPGEFQVNGQLCDTLARRNGYTQKQLDVDLPQRKFACYAADRKLPLIDLLPSLRLCQQSPYQRHTEAFNEQGHEAAAQVVGGWIQSRYSHQLSLSARLTKAQ